MQIVGICLFQNEELFLEQCLRNVAGFCDRLILLNNQSVDRSFEIAKKLCEEFSHFELHSIKSPQLSHAYIEEYANTNTWVLGVDGDEIYDPEGLSKFREELLTGTYNDIFCVMGNVLHCREVDESAKQAKGYLARPSRSMTKLYNFAGIHYWKNAVEERLHGGEISFKEGYSFNNRLSLDAEMTWENSPFRCLHAVFVKRSSVQKNEIGARMNIYDKNHTNIWEKILFSVNIFLGRESKISAKYDTYCRGDLVEKDIQPFFVN